ncbi:MAG: hypothetical protein JXQ83_15265 [Candidatus Glassbacteria bacterium]|nr:hypothetical protein [Candidatus Glassbacteria bacterium]
MGTRNGNLRTWPAAALVVLLGWQWIAPGPAMAGGRRELLAVTGIHQDIGFLDDYRTMMHDYREKMLGYLDLLEEHPQLAINWGNLYNLKDFLEYYPGQRQRIRKFVGQGRMVFPAQWVDYEPDWTPGEYLIRQCAYSVAYLKKNFGYRPVWCHLLDVPSITPQYAQVLAKSGVKMVLLHYNYHSPDYQKYHAPEGLALEAETALRGGVYEYVGLDGSGVIGYVGKEHYSMLCVAWGWYNDEFGPWRTSLDRFARHYSPEEQAVGLKLVHGDEDHGLSPAKIEVLNDSIAAWNQGSPYADSTTLRWGTVDEFVRAFEARKTAIRLEKFTGQARPWVWSGRFFERGRFYLARTVSDLLAAEKLASVNSMLGLSSYPAGEIDRAWEGLLWPADHNWLAGTDTDGFKAEALYQAHLEARHLLERELETMAAAVETEPGRRSLVVFNPVNWTRSYPVKVQIATRAGGFRVQAAGGGEQQTAWGETPNRAGRTIHFIAREVPGLGYRTYYLEELESPPETAPSGLSAAGDTLENELYRVVFDPVLGIRSVFDKKNGRQMVKPGFLRLDGAFMMDTGRVTPAFASRTLYYQDKSLTVRLYPGLDLVDLEVRAEDRGFMDELVRVFLPHEYQKLALRGPEILAAGPNSCPVEFALEDARLTCGVPFGAVPYVPGRTREHFPLSLNFSRRSPGRGYVSYFTGFGGLPNAVNIVKWLDCYEPGGDYGVALAYEQSQTELLVLDQATIRVPLYVQHPLANTVLRSPHQWRFVLRGHRGDWKAANAPSFGWEVSQPLLATERLSAGGARLPVQGAFLSADNPAVVVSGLKKSCYDNTFILHCAEMLDSDTRLEVKPAIIRLGSAAGISLAEDSRLAPLKKLAGGGFSLDLNGFSIEAVSLEAKK